MTQKLWRGHRVWVKSGLFDAIVVASYSDLHGPSDRHTYIIVELKGDTGVHWRAWFDEDDLSLVGSDRDEGEVILQAYKNR